ncbi:MAG: hypothetical protein AVDCRST_MAG48-3107, partial [uncultured Friedmanniella sp.]
DPRRPAAGGVVREPAGRPDGAEAPPAAEAADHPARRRRRGRRVEPRAGLPARRRARSRAAARATQPLPRRAAAPQRRRLRRVRGPGGAGRAPGPRRRGPVPRLPPRQRLRAARAPHPAVRVVRRRRAALRGQPPGVHGAAGPGLVGPADPLPTLPTGLV